MRTLYPPRRRLFGSETHPLAALRDAILAVNDHSVVIPAAAANVIAMAVGGADAVVTPPAADLVAAGSAAGPVAAASGADAVVTVLRLHEVSTTLRPDPVRVLGADQLVAPVRPDDRVLGALCLARAVAVSVPVAVAAVARGLSRPAPRRIDARIVE